MNYGGRPVPVMDMDSSCFSSQMRCQCCRDGHLDELCDLRFGKAEADNSSIGRILALLSMVLSDLDPSQET